MKTLTPSQAMPSITSVPCYCFLCDWAGVVWDCEPDTDGDGGLGCPCCGAAVLTEADNA